MGSNPVEALKSFFDCNCDYNYDNHISILSVFPQINYNYDDHVYFICIPVVRIYIIFCQ